MEWTKQLIPPMIYGGRGITDEKWEKAFGPRKDGLDLHDEPPPKEDVYARKLREYWETHGKPSEEK
jgi:hypothetical protein